ncbi:MAG: tetratricopeptide repeat protein [Geminicoccaceae bacterium]
MLLSIWLHAAGSLVLSANELTEQQGLLSDACDAGDGEACFKLGAVEAKETPNRAIPRYRRACVLGFASGCRLLGEAYVSGTGVTRDRTKGRTLLRQACDVDDVDACFLLSSVPGVRDRPELLEMACDAQMAEACYRLGSHYGDNPLSAGMPAIYEKATSYFKQACDAGHQQPRRSLGLASKTAEKSCRKLGRRSQMTAFLISSCRCGKQARAYPSCQQRSLGKSRSAQLSNKSHDGNCRA